jgi:MoxR-like ATPase
MKAFTAKRQVDSEDELWIVEESVLHGHHTPVMLWGAPGIGKSQIISQIATGHNVNMIDIRLSQMEPSDLRGIPFKNGEQVET